MQAARIFSLLLLSSPITLRQANRPNNTNFPNNDEIQLVVTQAERAFAQYEYAVTLEAELPSMQTDKTAVNRDHEALNLAKKLVTSLKGRLDAFHGPGGLLLLGVLDDTSRNSALCSASAFADITTGLLDKSLDRAKAYQFMHIGQTCQDTSTQLYTVSENVHALMLRELESQQALNAQASEAITRCTSALQDAKKAGSLHK